MTTAEAATFMPTPEILTELTPADVADFARLLPQLTGRPLTEAEITNYLEEAIAAPGTALTVIRDEAGAIQASATGVTYTIPTGRRGWVEDVVVDEASRGQGYGRRLMLALHDWFENQGIEKIALTSRHERVAAGMLYASLGYEERHTRVYGIHLGNTAAQTSIS